jgi:hypothetical protein
MSIAQHIRIFEKTPDDDFVQKRTKVIDALATKFLSSNDVGILLQLAADLTRGVAKGGAMPEARLTEIEAAIQAQSTSFVKEGQELQLVTCALLAALQCLNNAKPSDGMWTKRDVIAVGLWSGLGFQIPRSDERLEALRVEVLHAARNLVLATASKARVRRHVPGVVLELQEAYDQTKTGNSIQNSSRATIDALRANAALDREEIDLLWWLLSGWSKYADIQLSQLSPITAVVLAGLEAGTYVRRLPGEPHKQLLFRLITKDESFTLQQVIEGVAEQKDKLVSAFGNHQLLVGRESLYPLLHACTTGKPGGKANAAQTLKLSDWAARALLESAILHVGMLPHELV